MNQTAFDKTSPFHIRRRMEILLVLTIIGGALRFFTLNRPPISGDEALTYSRVIGSLDDLYSILQHDAFMPLHYEIYWWLHQGMPIGAFKLAPNLILTPAVMRIVPALCGTLLIPVMYFAARQICSVRVALLSAAFACFSAYMMAYSHDAKMYVQTWLFIALNMGCFWWWIRTRHSTAWLCWIAAGSAALGFHIGAALMIAPQLIFFLTARRVHWTNTLLLLLGALVMAAGPYGYYRAFNHWSQESGGILPAAQSDQGNWEESGIAWVHQHNKNATAPMLLRETISAYLTGVEWTDPARHKDVIEPQLQSIIAQTTTGVFIVLALGMFPWRWPAWTRWAGTRAPQSDPSPEPWWRVLLWLALLLLIPIYGFFYPRSFDPFASPLDWWSWSEPYLASPLTWLLAAAAIYLCGQNSTERVRKLACFLLIAAALIGVACVLWAFWNHAYQEHWARMRELYGADVSPETRPELSWQSVWMPRYVGIVWPALAIAAAILLMRLPTRPLRWTVIILILALNLAAALFRLFGPNTGPNDRVLADVLLARDHPEVRVMLSSNDPHHKGSALWLNSSAYGIYGSAGKYFACITLGLTPTPMEFRSGEITGQYEGLIGQLTMPESLPGEIASNSRTKRLIIWERYNASIAKPTEQPEVDTILEVLIQDWKPIGEPQIYPLRNWNDWTNLGWTRRREFVRK